MVSLGAASLTVNTEKIELESTASLTTSGAVTLAAHAANPDPAVASTLTAEAKVNGTLTAGATQVTAVAEQTLEIVVPLGRSGTDGVTIGTNLFGAATGNFTLRTSGTSS